MSNKEQLIYSGIPTFMGSDYVKEIEELKNYDVAFVGIPSDYGASYRLGAKYAVRKIREYSFWDRVDGQRYYDFDYDTFIQSNLLRIADFGDIEVNPTSPSVHQNNIEKTIYDIRKKCFPLVCGGDHSISYGSFLGCIKSHKEHFPDSEFGIIHFDAHLDVESTYLSMPKVWHGNVFRELIDNNYVKGENVFSIGVRGIVDEKWINYSHKNNMKVFSSNYIHNNGMINVFTNIIKLCKEKSLKIYITFDVDCIDISSVSGTGTPQSNGLSVTEIKQAFRMLKEIEVIGFDIVELNPLLDSSGASFVIACSLLLEFLSFGLGDMNYI